MTIDSAKIASMIEENRRRMAQLRHRYNPLSGIGCYGRRKRVANPEGNFEQVPLMMKTTAGMSREQWVKERCRCDFEYWAATCATIRNKTSGKMERFILNAPQRRVLKILEDMRLAGKPIRIIMLKARQWGGSTLIQLYMAWIQTTVQTNWNSLICAHVKDTASTIRGMYSRLIRNYPPEFWIGDEDEEPEKRPKPELKPFEASRNTRIIEGRGSTITLGSSENQDAVRGADYAMAHLSEVAFWKDSDMSSPEQFIRAICGSIITAPMTLIVLESTANGVGNYFHREWLRAEAGESDKTPVFVPWCEIEIYSSENFDAVELISGMDEYEWTLWDTHGCTLQQISWFHTKRREYPTLQMMLAEYPTTPLDAFMAVDRTVFSPAHCEILRQGCRGPIAIGEAAAADEKSVEGVRFAPDPQGRLKIWSWPGETLGGRYVAAVDVGGRSRQSDWSVITVIDRRGGAEGKTPEVVAQWRGHDYHDRLAWTAAKIATLYSGALLVFESNTYETENDSEDPTSYILDEVREAYHNLYYRMGQSSSTPRVGFHTNRATKSAIINRLIAAVRDGAYIERDHEAINELLTYETTSAGGFSARRDCHDDILMSRAIALHVAASMTPLAVADQWSAYGARFNPALGPHGTH